LGDKRAGRVTPATGPSNKTRQGNVNTPGEKFKTQNNGNNLQASGDRNKMSPARKGEFEING